MARTHAVIKNVFVDFSRDLPAACRSGSSGSQNRSRASAGGATGRPLAVRRPGDPAPCHTGRRGALRRRRRRRKQPRAGRSADLRQPPVQPPRPQLRRRSALRRQYHQRHGKHHRHRQPRAARERPGGARAGGPGGATGGAGGLGDQPPVGLGERDRHGSRQPQLPARGRRRSRRSTPTASPSSTSRSASSSRTRTPPS